MRKPNCDAPKWKPPEAAAPGCLAQCIEQDKGHSMDDTEFRKRQSGKLVLLVGSNPLPNYVAAVVLKPDELVLLYSQQTQEPCERLAEALKKRFSALETVKVIIQNAAEVNAIREACSGLKGCHLNYTGGTKTMAAHAHIACEPIPNQASYLDESTGLLRFDDGYCVDIGSCNLGITLDILLKLHAVERKPTKQPAPGDPSEADAAAMADWVLREPARAKPIYDWFKDKPFTNAKTEPWQTPADISLSVKQIPGDDWDKHKYERWSKFLTGAWQEHWMASMVRTCLGGGAASVEVGVICRRSKPTLHEFEIDVSVIRGHRLYVISCTTDASKPLCKSKLFEVAMRSRQIGGDLARCALVCLLSNNNNLVEELRADIADVWGASNVPEVFGVESQREWYGIEGEPNLTTLKEWLNS